MKCNERFMEQEGIDALAELWEETGTFRKTGGKKCYRAYCKTLKQLFILHKSRFSFRAVFRIGAD